MKIRIKFSKLGAMKFIGHLDLLRMFQKAFRRTNIPIAYSQGFNPHQLISIAAPLAIGITSSAEYMDIEISSHIDKQEAINQLNNTLPESIKIIDWIKLNGKSKSAMSIVGAAKYNIYLNNWSNISNIKTLIDDFFRQPDIIVTKKTKKKIKDINIKEGIYKYNYNDENKILELILAAGSKLNIKPELIIKALNIFIDKNNSLAFVPIHRLEIFARSDDQLSPFIALDQYI